MAARLARAAIRTVVRTQPGRLVSFSSASYSSASSSSSSASSKPTSTASASGLVREVAGRLVRAGIPSAVKEAQLLVAHGLGVSPTTLRLQDDQPVSDDQLAGIRRFVRRDAASACGMPLGGPTKRRPQLLVRSFLPCPCAPSPFPPWPVRSSPAWPSDGRRTSRSAT